MRWVDARIFPASDTICGKETEQRSILPVLLVEEQILLARTCNSEDDASGSSSGGSS